MERLQKKITNLSDSILDFKEVAGREDIQAANEELEPIRSDLTHFTIKNSYESYLVRYVKEAYEEFTSGDRTEPLCSCSNPYCKLKQGKLPSDIFLADSVEDGVRDFMIDHRGDGAVLLDAREQRVEDASRVIEKQKRALSILKSGRKSKSSESQSTSAEKSK